MKPLLTISRIIVGVLFIFSGLIKANDPLGLSYKMQEFFEIWGWHDWNDYTLMLSVLMIAFEIIAGVAVLLGWRMPLFSWLLLLLTVFFTFLTGYALFSGKIKECGCFGNCIPLTAQQSFMKDLLLLGLILFIFSNRHKIKRLLPGAVALPLLLLTTVLSFGFQWYVLKYLPVVDCLPYKVGSNIPAQMQIPPGAIPDSTVITFVYQKQGKEVEFTADKFPDDFNDSLYQFVKRYDKLVRKGNADIPIKDFALMTLGGTDTTQNILQAEGYQALVFTKGMTDDYPDWMESINTLHTRLKAKNIPVIFVTSDYDNIAKWIDKAAGDYKQATILKCDFVAIKTAARADPTLYLIRKGDIINKWSHADFDKAATFVQNIK